MFADLMSRWKAFQAGWLKRFPSFWDMGLGFRVEFGFKRGSTTVGA